MQWLPPGAFQDQVAVVTGGGTGLGLEISRGLARFATREEVAAHCLVMLSGACDYVTGECLVVDGGASLGQGMWQPGERFTRKRAAQEPG